MELRRQRRMTAMRVLGLRRLLRRRVGQRLVRCRAPTVGRAPRLCGGEMMLAITFAMLVVSLFSLFDLLPFSPILFVWYRNYGFSGRSSIVFHFAPVLSVYADS